MAVELQCPKCQAKLQLDEAPGPDEAVECPKCEHQFVPPPPKRELPPEMKAKKGGGGKKGGKPAKGGEPGTLRKRKVKQKKSNPFVLALMVAGALVILACLSTIGYLLLSKSGKMEELLSYVPGDCNVIRGVNVYQVSRYPGYKGEMDRQLADIQPVADALATLLGAGKDDFIDYAIVAKKKSGGTTPMMVLFTRRPFDAKDAKLGGESQVDGQTVYASNNATGLLNGAKLFAPTNRHVVIVGRGPHQDAMLRAAIGGQKNRADMLYAKAGATGQLITKKMIWQMVRAEGDLKNYIKDLGDPIKTSFKALADQMAKAKTWGIWTSFGARGVYLGSAVECDSKETASGIAKSVREGPMGKGDDSEPPNDLKAAYSQISNKDVKAYFLSEIQYQSSGESVYFEARMLASKAGQMTGVFNNPNLGEPPAFGRQ